jgi:hypothetical protein
VEGLDSHVQLVAVVVRARMRIVEPLSSESGFTVKDLMDGWICFVVRIVEPLSSESGFTVKDLMDGWICFVVIEVVVQRGQRLLVVRPCWWSRRQVVRCPRRRGC